MKDLKNIEFSFTTDEDYKKEADFLRERDNQAMTIQGTQKTSPFQAYFYGPPASIAFHFIRKWPSQKSEDPIESEVLRYS